MSKVEFWDEEPDEELVPELEKDIDVCSSFEKEHLDEREKRKRIDRNNPRETMNPGGKAWRA